jgi:hypothetical protein
VRTSPAPSRALPTPDQMPNSAADGGCQAAQQPRNRDPVSRVSSPSALLDSRRPAALPHARSSYPTHGNIRSASKQTPMRSKDSRTKAMIKGPSRWTDPERYRASRRKLSAAAGARSARAAVQLTPLGRQRATRSSIGYPRTVDLRESRLISTATHGASSPDSRARPETRSEQRRSQADRRVRRGRTGARRPSPDRHGRGSRVGNVNLADQAGMLDDLTDRWPPVTSVQPVSGVDLADRVDGDSLDRQAATEFDQALDVPGMEPSLGGPEVGLLADPAQSRARSVRGRALSCPTSALDPLTTTGAAARDWVLWRRRKGKPADVAPPSVCLPAGCMHRGDARLHMVAEAVARLLLWRTKDDMSKACGSWRRGWVGAGGRPSVSNDLG